MPVNYTNREIMQMREQAIMRAREMQSRAAIKEADQKQPSTSDKHSSTKEPPQDNDTFKGKGTLHFEKRPEYKEVFSYNSPRSNNVHASTTTHKQQQKPSVQDNDRMLIMTLLLILIADGADKMLIFALMYIMM